MESLRIAQFGRLALYFPVYLGIKKGFFKKFGIKDIEFIETFNDCKTFMMLLENKADIGLSDPIFAIPSSPSKTTGISFSFLFSHTFLPLCMRQQNSQPIYNQYSYHQKNKLRRAIFPVLLLVNFRD